MRKYILFYLLFFYSVIAFSQYEEKNNDLTLLRNNHVKKVTIKYQTEYINEGFVRNILILNLDTLGNIVDSTVFWSTNGNLHTKTDFKYIFDTQNRIVKIIKNTSGKKFEEVYVYDDNGKITSIAYFDPFVTTYQNLSGLKWTANYSYDTDGKLILLENVKGDFYSNTSTKYEYIEKSKLYKSIHTEPGLSTETFYYDENSNIIKSEKLNNHKLYPIITNYKYEYDSNKRVTKKSEFYENSKSNETTYKYNSNGLLDEIVKGIKYIERFNFFYEYYMQK